MIKVKRDVVFLMASILFLVLLVASFAFFRDDITIPFLEKDCESCGEKITTEDGRTMVRVKGRQAEVLREREPLQEERKNLFGKLSMELQEEYVLYRLAILKTDTDWVLVDNTGTIIAVYRSKVMKK